jgi:hypothetical protein
VLVTEPTDWGGWRVPGAEYDRDPYKIEAQARLLVNAPKLLRLAEGLVESVKEANGEAPPEMQRLSDMAAELLDAVRDPDAPPQPALGQEPPPAVQAAE